MLRSRIVFAGPVTIAALVLGFAGPASSQLPDVSVPSISSPVGSTPSVSTIDQAVAETSDAAASTVQATASAVQTTASSTVQSAASTVQATVDSTPSTSVPSTTVPSVTVSTESVPATQTPVVTTPSVTIAPSGGGGGVTVATSGTAMAVAPGSVSVSSQTSAPTGVALGALRPTTRPGTTAATGSDVLTATRIFGPTGTELPGATPRERLQALRRLVLALDSCLAGLPAAEREVLELRAGVGIDHPRTRKQVGRMTGVSDQRVRQLERSGLRHLRTLSRNGCDRGQSGSAFGLGAASTLGAQASDKVHVLGETVTGVDAPQSRTPSDRPPYVTAAESGDAVPDVALFLAPIVVLAFLMFAAKEVRRTMGGF